MKGIKLDCQTKGGLTTACDPKRIEQVLSNLLSNALKFSRKGSIVVKAIEEGNFAQIEVCDSGAGIPPGELPDVFDRFSQEKNENGAKGTGIGLFIAKKWVEAHGGKIWVKSDGQGKGSTFGFNIPKNQFQVEN